jgi:hypothetical protein
MNTKVLCLALWLCAASSACCTSEEATGGGAEGAPAEAPARRDKPGQDVLVKEEPPKEEPVKEEEVKAPPAEVPAQVEGANLSVESMDVDGFSTRGLSCKLEGGGGLLGGPLIVGVIAKEKDALRACAPSPRDVRVGFSAAADGAMTGIAVADAGDPKVAACVAGVLGKLKSPSPGRCVITLALAPAQP